MTESNREPLWSPSDDQVNKTQMFAFMQKAAREYGFSPNWSSLHEWSVANRADFWKEMLQFAEITPSKPASSTFEGEGMLGTRWFPGMELNFARHLLRFDDDRIAIQAEDERERTRSITYSKLNGLVAGCAAGMRAMGLKRGDRVGGFLPNIPEAIIAMLATASIGATWSSCSPDFGIGGVFDRFGQIEPKLLIAADGYSYNGKRIDSLKRVRGIVEKISSIQKVVIVPFLDESPDISPLMNAQMWSDFLGSGGGQSATYVDASAVEPVSAADSARTEVRGSLVFESVPFDHPIYIMYSSGTTGVPKCIVHGVGGTLLQHMKELMLHCDLRREDNIFYFTTCGWMMWNWLVSSLGVGATVVLYEGSPFHPTPHHLWQMAERMGISVFGLSPKFVSACENAGLQPGKEHDLSNLRAVLSTGSPLTVENFRWVYKHVKKDLQLSSICGGTDIISCFMLGNPILPVHAGEIQCKGLGMDMHAFDADAKSVLGEKGELVCCTPFPSQPTCFWNDPEGSKYSKAYFDDYPDTWRHGDFIEITEHGGVIVYGRSDATLNPGGIRIGTAEIYRLVETLNEIIDSVVAGKRTDDADVDVCLFVVLRDGSTLDDEIIGRIKKCISDGATKRHIPRYIKQVTAVPYTISGKKVELAVTQMIHGEPVPNRDALTNPESLDQYAGIV